MGEKAVMLLSEYDKKRYYLREKGVIFINILFSLSILITLVPLLSIIALLIAFESPGPVLFRQKRLGKNGKAFLIYKFRSMFHNGDQSIHKNFIAQALKNPSGKPIEYRIKNDPRITRVGKWLRKLSLDELPQFLNVLKGDMNIVGPRPLLTYEAEYFQDWHWQRLIIKPGITGLYQVSARGRVPFDEMVKKDIEYIRQRTLWLDLKLILLTVRAILERTGG